MVNLKTEILTTYLTKDNGFSQHDSSARTEQTGPNNYNLIKNWYESVNNLKIKNTIFYNDLSLSFIKKYESDYTSFSLYDGCKRLSYNDERFFIYEEYLQKSDSDYVFFTDLFDVIFLKNPFDLIISKPEYDLFVGSEISDKKNSKWLKTKCLKEGVMLPSTQYELGSVIFNAGIIGGSKANLLKLFKSMNNMFSELPKNTNSNMLVFNYCIDKYFDKSKIFYGHPLHNVFKSNSFDQQTYIKHK